MSFHAINVFRAGWFKAGLMLAGALLFVLLLTVFIFYKKSSKEILIESQESKTQEDQPVFNKIKYIKDGDRDIWMMNQSHSGLAAGASAWERLAIVVSGAEVSFYQFESGPLEWSDELKQKQRPYRVSCFMCHSNGPRALRPAQDRVVLTWSEKVQVFFWNLRIKTYGRLQESSEMKEADQVRMTPFRYQAELDNEPLSIQSCSKCHNESGFLSRGSLTRQNRGTIRFMVAHHQMPPPGFSLTQQDEKQLNRFISGF